MAEKDIINESLVVITQNAIIDFSGIPRIIKSVKSRIHELDLENIEATDDNKAMLKNLRTKLNNEFKEYESARKDIKNVITNPYNEFENAYKPLKELFDNASDDLKSKIDEVEDKQRENKRNDLTNYFYELRTLLTESIKDIGMNLEFVSFDMLDLNITISASETKLRDEIKSGLERICNDLRVIAGHNHKARLYAKYISTLDLSKALFSLQNELELEKEIISDTPPIVEVKKQETQNESVEQVVEEIKEFFIRVEDTESNLNKVIDFMITMGINYNIVKRKGAK